MKHLILKENIRDYHPHPPPQKKIKTKTKQDKTKLHAYFQCVEAICLVCRIRAKFLKSLHFFQ